jgi:Glycosyltransferase family 10 (fucosyltransferase) C-term
MIPRYVFVCLTYIILCAKISHSDDDFSKISSSSIPQPITNHKPLGQKNHFQNRHHNDGNTHPESKHHSLFKDNHHSLKSPHIRTEGTRHSSSMKNMKEDTLSSTNNSSFSQISTVHVYHLLNFDNGMLYSGEMNCSHVHCHWTNSDDISSLCKTLHNDMKSYLSKDISVGVYNIHFWWSKAHRKTHPMRYSKFPTNLSIVESEESRGYHSRRFDTTFPNFDAFSTTNPVSPIQRFYIDAYMRQFRHKIVLNRDMIPGGSFVAQDCREGSPNESKRFKIVLSLRQLGIRVDGLGGCLELNPDKVDISKSNSDFESKRSAISRYLFHMAFENTLEIGYVTEKPFDALMAGMLLTL